MADGQIDLGDNGWKHPGLEGVTYGAEGYARRDAERDGLDPDKVFEVDTRPTVSEVAKRIGDDEQHVWDEYFSVSHEQGADRWPDGRICVFVVTGGSEGLYIHIEVRDSSNETKCLILGKTLSCSVDKWYECWMSAARIARMLGA